MTPITLTPSQQIALEQLLAAMAEGRSTALHGHAGTGKTTVVAVLIEQLLRQGKTVWAAAPTHKAAEVLRGKVPASIEVRTVASLLRLKPRQEGRFIRFLQDRRAAPVDLSSVDVLVVDESSMVSQQLGSSLMRVAGDQGVGLIFVGDPGQLPPVDPPPGFNDDEDWHKGVMAEAFLSPPGGAIVLDKVVRHQGPVLGSAPVTLPVGGSVAAGGGGRRSPAPSDLRTRSNERSRPHPPGPLP
jgi:energy-coupling factor transporter ATP-binding protein EcfA2